MGGLVEKLIVINNLIAQDIVLSKINCSKVTELVLDKFGKFSTVTLCLYINFSKMHYCAWRGVVFKSGAVFKWLW